MPESQVGRDVTCRAAAHAQHPRACAEIDVTATAMSAEKNVFILALEATIADADTAATDTARAAAATLAALPRNQSCICPEITSGLCAYRVDHRHQR